MVPGLSRKIAGRDQRELPTLRGGWCGSNEVAALVWGGLDHRWLCRLFHLLGAGQLVQIG